MISLNFCLSETYDKMKTFTYLISAACLFVWAFVNLVSNTLVFKQVNGDVAQVWIIGAMLIGGIVPLCIAIWLVLASGLFPSAVVPEIMDKEPKANAPATPQQSREKGTRNGKRKRRK